MSSPSASEGEIIEKANTTASKNRIESSVDHSTRALFLDKSPRGEKRRRDSGERGQSQERDRERSRRPDRHGDLDTTRTDSRQFRVHYEGPISSHQRRGQDQYGHSPRFGPRASTSSYGQEPSRSRISYADIDRGDSLRHASRYDDRGSRPTSFDRRPRRRSRSPMRNGRREYRDRYDSYDDFDKEDVRYRDSRRGSNSSGGSEARDYGSEKSYQSRHSAGNGGKPQAANNSNQDVTRRSLNERGPGHKESDSSRKPRDGRDGKIAGEAASAAKPADTTSDNVIDTKEKAELTIEERRKRREAIRAKHNASQAPPLLVQALHQGNGSALTTPLNSTPDPFSGRSVSPMIVSPSSPKQISTPASPASFTMQSDDHLANRIQTNQDENGDEPSAADYDPTVDMKEDQARNGHRQQNDMPAVAYDEVLSSHHDVLLPNNNLNDEGTTKKKESSGYDIFGDNDDDAEPLIGEATLPTTAVPVPAHLNQSLPGNWDDHEGYYMAVQGELLDNRYQVQGPLGKGVFSNVAKAIDRKTNSPVAIKVIRNNDVMKAAGMQEIGILQTLRNADPTDKKHIVRFDRHFNHRGHLCMVFEYLDMNLREVLKKFGRSTGITLSAIRSYARQMFLGLSLMKQCNLLHADLKPDNLLVGESLNLLKMCDLGSAVDASEATIAPYLASRFYRAPEIMLGMEYDFAIDMWSIGCTLYELYTGKILFAGRNNNQMLRAIMECRGKFPQKMLNKADLAKDYFDDTFTTFYSLEKDPITDKDIVRPLSAIKPTKDLKGRVMAHAKNLKNEDKKQLQNFVDLLDRCLTLNPERRCTPNEALKHPFISRPKG